MTRRGIKGAGAVRTIGASVWKIVRGKAFAAIATVHRTDVCVVPVVNQFLLERARRIQRLRKSAKRCATACRCSFG